MCAVLCECECVYVPSGPLAIVFGDPLRTCMLVCVRVRTKTLPECKSDFATGHVGEISVIAASSFPFLPLSVFVATIARDRDTVSSCCG